MPVFGILERNGVVRVDVVKDVTARRLLEMTLRMVRRGPIIYTDKFHIYDAPDVLRVSASAGGSRETIFQRQGVFCLGYYTCFMILRIILSESAGHKMRKQRYVTVQSIDSKVIHANK